MFNKILIILALAGVAAFFAGCETANEDESGLPWSRPANWEGGAPGMAPGSSPGRDRY